MAKRTGILAKMKIVYKYSDVNGDVLERSKTFSNLKCDQAAEKILAAGNALGSLQEDTVDSIREIAEYELMETA